MNTFLFQLRLTLKSFQRILDPAIEGTPYEEMNYEVSKKKSSNGPNTPFLRKKFAMR